jgi:hypothetical protein
VLPDLVPDRKLPELRDASSRKKTGSFYSFI